MQKSIIISPVDGKRGEPGQVYYPIVQHSIPRPTPNANELLVKLTAVSLNHRDVFVRQQLYFGVAFDCTLCSDGVGIVTAAGSDVRYPQKWLGKRVILNPGIGWKDAPDGPEDPTGYHLLGGTVFYRKGTLQELIAIDESEVEEAPPHLTDAEAAALPVTGLTAWRALEIKIGEKSTGNLLITGIGGGVALIALRMAVARGADVYVTSSSEEKLQKAVELGARGGVNYKEERWEKKLLEMLPPEKRFFDAVLDGAGGDIIEKGTRLLRAGGVICLYGMTVAPTMPFSVKALLKNIDVRCATMGSRKDFKEMVQFVKQHKIYTVVSRVLQTELDDVAGIDTLFDELKEGKQFGKLVIEFGKDGESKL